MVVASLPVFLAFFPPPAQAQDRGDEVVANLAVGHVLICVTRDGILVATLGTDGEPGSRPPTIIPMASSRIGVLLGTTEWVYPGASNRTVRLDAELPVAAANALRPPSAQPPQPGPGASPGTGPGTSVGTTLGAQQAADSGIGEIESIGIALLELLRAQLAQFHHKLDLAPNEPILQLLLTNYVEGYGPEAWLLQYRVRQQVVNSDYWHTSPLRPSYTQLYPPEKDQPRTFIDVVYPPATKSAAGLRDLLSGNDAQLAAMKNASPEITEAVNYVVKGESNKARSAEMTNFLRAALPVLAGDRPTSLDFASSSLYAPSALATRESEVATISAA
jgi:hypothetical protein